MQRKYFNSTSEDANKGASRKRLFLFSGVVGSCFSLVHVVGVRVLGLDDGLHHPSRGKHVLGQGCLSVFLPIDVDATSLIELN